MKKAGVAVVSAVNESKVKGWVSFHKIKRKQVLVKAKITGLNQIKNMVSISINTEIVETMVKTQENT